MGRRSRRARDRFKGAGVLLVDKPVGPTSHDVVARARRILGCSRIGHTGTLDPLASGLMVLCVGEATKLSPYLTHESKRYTTTVMLGAATDSYDAAGEITAQDAPEAVAAIGRPEVDAALPAFIGEITQRPPVFSAIKVDGKRLHARARAGEDVEAPERQVRVDTVDVLEVRPGAIELDVRCGPGTYIRSLGHDLARALGVHGHLTALRRTEVGRFRVDDALSLGEPGPEEEARVLAALISASASMAHLPRAVADERARAWLADGRAVPFPDVPEGLCRVVDDADRLLALVEARGSEPAPIVRGFRDGA